jgi:hypothetical protein
MQVTANKISTKGLVVRVTSFPVRFVANNLIVLTADANAFAKHAGHIAV